jgi:hypothetical protein
MQSRTKMHVLRGMGGLIAAMAVVPWLGAGAAQAASQNDGSCSTRPSGVAADATCTLLLGPNGKTVFGETWAVRTKDNELTVKTFPNSPPDGSDSVSLCVSTTPYPAKHQCNAGDPDNASTGTATVITVALGSFSISPTDPVYYSLSVLQASTTAVSNGNGGKVPSPSPSPSESTSPTQTQTQSPSSSPTKTHTQSPSASPTKTHTQSPSVLATSTHKTNVASPSTSVLALKLAHTGPDGTENTLILSLGLLALGGILVAAGQSNRPKRRH